MIRTIAAAGAAMALLTPAVAGAQSTSKSPNVEHVGNVKYELRYGQTKSYGTDQEFEVIRNRTYLFAGSYTNGMQIFDVTDGGAPELMSVYDCAISQGDVQVFRQEDQPGRVFATYTADSNASTSRAQSGCYADAEKLGYAPRRADGTGKQGTFILDVTNPRQPRTVSFIEFTKGSHNQTVHPSGNFLYNSNSELITNIASSAIEIYDISDLEKPVRKPDYVLLKIPASLGNDSHDITFSKDGKRAYSAALSHEEIIDTTDPANPKRVGTIVDPAVNVWHQSDPITIGGKTFLVAEDEFVGAIGTNQCPNGGVHVYDITGSLEANPVKVGYWNISDVGTASGSCTAHVFRLYEEAGLMTISFYNGGVRVVDLKGLTGVGVGTQGVMGMREIAHFKLPDSNSWSAKAPRIEEDGSMWLYSNDINRGLDVLRVTGTKPGSSAKGQWLTPAQAHAKLAGRQAPADARSAGLVCLLPQ